MARGENSPSTRACPLVGACNTPTPPVVLYCFALTTLSLKILAVSRAVHLPVTRTRQMRRCIRNPTTRKQTPRSRRTAPLGDRSSTREGGVRWGGVRRENQECSDRRRGERRAAKRRAGRIFDARESRHNRRSAHGKQAARSTRAADPPQSPDMRRREGKSLAGSRIAVNPPWRGARTVRYTRAIYMSGEVTRAHSQPHPQPAHSHQRSRHHVCVLPPRLSRSCVCLCAVLSSTSSWYCCKREESTATVSWQSVQADSLSPVGAKEQEREAGEEVLDAPEPQAHSHRYSRHQDVARAEHDHRPGGGRFDFVIDVCVDV